jgi:hypothetical protein
MYKRYRDGEVVDSTVLERIQKLEDVGFVWSLAPGEDGAESSCGGSSDDDRKSDDRRGGSSHGSHPCASKAENTRQQRDRSSLKDDRTYRDGNRTNGTPLKHRALALDNFPAEKLKVTAADDISAHSNNYDSKDQSDVSDEDDNTLVI